MDDPDSDSDSQLSSVSWGRSWGSRSPGAPDDSGSADSDASTTTTGFRRVRGYPLDVESVYRSFPPYSPPPPASPSDDNNNDPGARKFTAYYDETSSTGPKRPTSSPRSGPTAATSRTPCFARSSGRASSAPATGAGTTSNTSRPGRTRTGTSATSAYAVPVRIPCGRATSRRRPCTRGAAACRPSTRHCGPGTPPP